MVVSPSGKTLFVTGTTAQLAYHTVAYNTATGAQRWKRTYPPGSNNLAFATAIAVSPSGTAVFVTGYKNQAPFTRYATVAYNAVTGAQLWAKQYGPKGFSSRALSVAVSPLGKTVFVTGWSGSANSGSADATVAYNAATGAQRWVKRYGNHASSGASLAVSPSGKVVFVAGATAVTTSSGTWQYPVTIAYRAATGARLWVKRYANRANDQSQSVVVSPGGNRVFVIVDGALGSPRKSVFATIAYAPSTGARLWARRYTGPSGTSNGAASVAVSPTGKRVFVTGFTAGTDGQFYLTVGYGAATGVQQWAKRYSAPGGGSGADSVAVSPTGGSVYVTGSTITVSSTSSFPTDYATIAYNPGTGAQQWVALYGNDINSLDYASSVEVSPDGGTVFVTGTAADDQSNGWATIAYKS